MRYRLPAAAELLTTMDTLKVIEVLGDPGALPAALGSLDEAWSETGQLLGEDPTGWQLGRSAQNRLPASAAATGGSLPCCPDGLPGVPPRRHGEHHQLHRVQSKRLSGQIRRVISEWPLDVGRWDDAEMTNAPGQSGDPRSPFYDNLLEGWATDSSFPLLYSREAVEANRAERIQLIPE